jgi:hypothetical protein
VSKPPVDAEARGRRALWQTASRQRFATMVGLFNDPTVVQAAHLFMRTNTARRIGPAIVLQRKFQNCATLEAADIKGRRPILLWSVPGVSADRKLSFDERHATSSVHYVLAGIQPGLHRGGWGLSVTDHAIGRFCQRNRGADIDAVVREGHLRLLGAPERSVGAMIEAEHFLIPTTGGGWWANAMVAKSRDTGNDVLYVRCHTWLNEHMIHDTQRAAAAELLTCQPSDRPLFTTLLHPIRGLPDDRR